MVIKDITIKHFRGFEEKHFDFDPRMNVVLGNNTAGKTTLLHAVQIALGAYMQSLSLLPKEKAYRRNFVATDRMLAYNEAEDEFLYTDQNPNITVNATLLVKGKKGGVAVAESKDISWYREAKGNTTIHAKANVGELTAVVDTLESIRRSADEGTNVVLPLVLAFGADRIDNNYRLAVDDKARDSRIVKAFKYALAETVDFKSALDWYYKYDSKAKKAKEVGGTDRAFEKALEVGARLQNIARDADNRGLWADVTVTGQPTHRLKYEMMSSGFKAMVNIVAEIAYRCIMLNRWLGEEAVRQTPGVVLIDEVDLYLHPHWQQHVLQDLQEAFPSLQFIVTSHSPFIAQSVESSNIITLDGYKDMMTSPNKRGIEEVIASEMGMSGMLRSEKYRRQLDLADRYYRLVKEGKAGREDIDKVKKELESLELELSMMHDPAFEAFLRFNRGDL